MAIKNPYPTPTREQVEQAEDLLAQQSAGKRKLSLGVIFQLEVIVAHFEWHLMDTHDRERAFVLLEQQRQAE
jgi:hypothetical protein